MTEHSAENDALGPFFVYHDPIIVRAANHGCLDEDVETGDTIACAKCCAFPPKESA